MLIKLVLNGLFFGPPFFDFCYFVNRLQPAGETEQVFIVDINMPVYFAAVIIVACAFIGVVIVNPVEPDALVQHPVDCLKQLLATAAGIDNNVMPGVVKPVYRFGSVGLLAVDGRVFATADCAVKVDCYNHTGFWLLVTGFWLLDSMLLLFIKYFDVAVEESGLAEQLVC